MGVGRLAAYFVVGVSLCLISCDKSDDGPTRNAPPDVPPPAPVVEPEPEPEPASPGKTTGKQSPDAVLDAMIAAANAGDEKAFFEVQTDDSDIAVPFEKLLDMLKGDGTREDALKNFFTTASDGFAIRPQKRFPAEVEGDAAKIVILNPNQIFKDKIQFARYDFVKSDGLWYYTKKTLGKYEKLDAEQYPFDGDWDAAQNP